MRIAILATGDELIQGDTLNTNTYAIAQGLNSENLSPGSQMTAADDEGEMLSCLNFLSQNHAIIIITGGLGNKFALGGNNDCCRLPAFIVNFARVSLD